MAMPVSAAERAQRSVFVGNIPYEATEEQLKEIFCQAGPVASFRIVYDRETGKPKGYGFCEYQDLETAQSAMRNLNNTDFNGRPLRVGAAAGETAKDDRPMQQALGGPVQESPYGEPVEPHEAPEAISRAVASLPPEQMYELMKQMKVCIQNNPAEARKMLLQNPQLAYALLQAQIVMKIVDPQVALAMLHRDRDSIPPVKSDTDPTSPTLNAAGLLANTASSSANQPPVLSQAQPMNSMAMTGAAMTSNQMSGGTGMMPGMGMNQPMTGAPINRMAGQGSMGNMNNSMGGAMGMPNQMGNNMQNPMNRGPGGQGPGGQFMQGAPMGNRGPMPGMSGQGPMPGMSGQGPMQGMSGQQGPMPGMGAMGGPGSMQGGPRGPQPGFSGMGGPQAGGMGGPVPGAPMGNRPGFPAAAGPDQEKAQLIMQVLQLSDEQIAMLPPDQRESILILKQQIGKNH